MARQAATTSLRNSMRHRQGLPMMSYSCRQALQRRPLLEAPLPRTSATTIASMLMMKGVNDDFDTEIKKEVLPEPVGPAQVTTPAGNIINYS